MIGNGRQADQDIETLLDLSSLTFSIKTTAMSLESELPPEASLNPEDVSRILSYLELPSSSTSALPLPPLEFLNKYLPLLPFELALPFGQVTTPRQRAPIKTIKSRRLIHASSTPRPSDLTAERGRLRWPLLWERMGGTSLPPPTANVQEEESWVQDNFLSGREGSQHVKKLGGLLRGFEEEREMMDLVAARRAERRLDSAGEEFDEESDEELEPSPRLGPPNGVNGARSGGVPVPPEHVATVNEHEQEEIKRAFEKQLVELFVDGLDVSCRRPSPSALADPRRRWTTPRSTSRNLLEAILPPSRIKPTHILTTKNQV